ncbi:MAG: FtsX-like permease family protein [Bacilli bacterium]|nr:FtsX-like permease family protein [Bacilli bacterium]
MKLGFQLAKSFLSSGKSQTIFIIIGIAVGIAVQVFIGTLIMSLQKSLVDKTIGNSPQIVIYNKDGINYNEIIKEINTEEIEYISPVLNNNIAIKLKDEVLPVFLKETDIKKANNIYNISNRKFIGKLPVKENEIILGTSFNTKIKENEIITLINKNNEKKYKVVGFFDLGVSSINETFAFSISNENLKINELEITVIEDKLFEVDKIKEQMQEKLGKDYEITTWKEKNESLLSGLQGQSISSIMIQVFVVVSVVLAIASVLTIMVIQKSKQIGILKAMGLNRKTSMYTFLFQGLILGVIGGILGIIFGYLLLKMFTTFAVNDDLTPVVPIYINNTFMIISLLISIVAASVSSIIPAIKSSKLNPIDIIRNN